MMANSSQKTSKSPLKNELGASLDVATRHRAAA
jgi:hypothetical protein